MKLSNYFSKLIVCLLLISNYCIAQEADGVAANESKTEAPTEKKSEPKVEPPAEKKSEPKVDIKAEKEDIKANATHKDKDTINHKNLNDIKSSISKLDNSIKNNIHNNKESNKELSKNTTIDTSNITTGNKVNKASNINIKDNSNKVIKPTNSLSLSTPVIIPANNKSEELSHIEITTPPTSPPNNKLPIAADNNTIQDSTMSQYGKIITKQEVSDGMIAWVIEKNSHRVILYTSPNKSIVIHGMAWDIKNKSNLNKVFAPYLVTNNIKTNIISNTNAVNNTQDWKTKKFNTPDILTALNNISGIKEGNGNVLDTVYVFFDPRCPYCQKAYANSRNYISQGKSIKWIPALLLGEGEQAKKNSAMLLQADESKKSDTLKKVLGDKENFNIEISSASNKALLVNKQALNILAQKNHINELGIPIAFFFDKRTGKAKYLKAVHVPEVMQEIFNGI